MTLTPVAVSVPVDDAVSLEGLLVDVEAECRVVERQAPEREDVVGGSVDHADGRADDIDEGGVDVAIDKQRRPIRQGE